MYLNNICKVPVISTTCIQPISPSTSPQISIVCIHAGLQLSAKSIVVAHLSVNATNIRGGETVLMSTLLFQQLHHFHLQFTTKTSPNAHIALATHIRSYLPASRFEHRVTILLGAEPRPGCLFIRISAPHCSVQHPCTADR